MRNLDFCSSCRATMFTNPFLLRGVNYQTYSLGFNRARHADVSCVVLNNLDEKHLGMLPFRTQQSVRIQPSTCATTAFIIIVTTGAMHCNQQKNTASQGCNTFVVYEGVHNCSHCLYCCDTGYKNPANLLIWLT